MTTQLVTHDVARHPATATGLIARLPLAVLALLTVGFLAYTLGAASGLFSPFLGGYIGVVTVAMLTPSVLAYVTTLSTARNGWTGADASLFLFTAIFAAIALLNDDSDYGHLHENATSHYFVAIQFVTFFCMSKLLPLEGARARSFLIALAVGATAMVLLLTQVEVQPDITSGNVDVADYQQVATYYVILLYLGAALIESGVWRTALYLAGSIALFLNGARTEMLGWLLAIMVVETFRSRQFATFGLAGLLLVPLASGIGGLLVQYFPDNRLTALIEYGSYDQSYLERKYILDQAMLTITSHPIAGDYGQYEPGRYAHNMLSVWQDFGLFPFLLFAITLFFTVGRSITLYRAKRRDPLTLLLAATSAVALGEFAFSKAFSNPLYPLTMALYARSLMERSAHDV